MTVEAPAPRTRAPERQHFTLDDVKQTYKRKDAWWTVLLVDPVASRLTPASSAGAGPIPCR